MDFFTYPILNPTLSQLEIMVALVEHSNPKIAAYSLGIKYGTLKGQMYKLYERIGANSRAHAVYLMWPILEDNFLVPTDRRSGLIRRTRTHYGKDRL